MTDPPPEGTIWDALNDWGQSLPEWQRFVVAYAVRDGALSPKEIDEAYYHFLRKVGLGTGDDDLPPIPDSVTGRVDQSSAGQLLVLAVKNLENVNAISSNSELTFGPGLTIVYGGNGTGKSGFARMLSAACFSRSKRRILPNVYEGDATNVEPSANIVVRQGNGADETIKVTQETENTLLRRVSVFDSANARIHLAEETPLGFQPSGFNVFDEIVRCIGEITNRLDGDIASRTRENKFGEIFIDESDIANEVDKLSKDTDMAALRALATFGQAESDCLAEVDRQLEELKASSPAKMLKSWTRAKEDIEATRKKITTTNEKLGKAACAEFCAQLDDLRAKTTAAATVKPQFWGNPSLQTTDSPEWVTFIKAGRDLGKGEKEDYPENGDSCLLCHRPLDEPSSALIRRFWGFLDDETRTAAEAANNVVTKSVEALKTYETALLPEESRVRADLIKVTPSLVKTLERPAVDPIQRV